MKRFILSASLALAAFSANAVQVSPLYAEYPATHSSGVFNIKSTESTAKTYQITVEEWVVENGQKVRKPSTELRFAPSVVTVQPGARQTVRYVRKSTKQSEGAYRIVVREVPDITKPDAKGIVYAMGLDFPWFWRTATQQPKVTGHMENGYLVVRNSGDATAQLTHLKTGDINIAGLIGYVLPGEEASFKVKGKPGSSVELRVNKQPVTLVAE